MTRFKSRVDASIALLGLAAVAAIAIGVTPSILYQQGAEAWLSVAMLFAAEGLILSIFLFTYYDIDGNTLSVRSGPLFWHIPINDITSIKPSNSFISGPVAIAVGDSLQRR